MDFSGMPDEYEVLFSICIVWRIAKVFQSETGTWNVELILSEVKDGRS
ncbi:unnamed protein product, partial [Didymodactylos carnosus]